MTESEMPSIRAEQLAIPAAELAALREIIGSVKWKFAWTMRFIPHWYVMPKIPGPLGHCDPEPFYRFAKAIEHYGFDAYFGKNLNRYLAVDGWKYWAWFDDDPCGNSIINRARVKGHPRWLRRPDDMGWIENPDWHPAPESPRMEVVETATKRSTRSQLRLDEE
jgi:hypothetical protein